METKRLKEDLRKEPLIVEFIKVYNYGRFIMYGTDENGLFVLWKHWRYLNPEREARRIYIGKINKQIKIVYKWHY
jgi:hypothetical protein